MPNSFARLVYVFIYNYPYLTLVFPVIIASVIIQWKMKSICSKYSRISNVRGITGAQAAYGVLSYYGITDVQIVCGVGKLTDHYDPLKKIIVLSPEVFNRSSIAAVGIACHEAGHAAQHAEEYLPIKIRNTILPVCKFGSSAALPLIIAGAVLSFGSLIYAGIFLFAFVVIFQFVTLPVEFNASGRALRVIESTGVLNNDEKDGAAKVLKAAAMTYVAALAVSLANLLRFIIVFGGRKRR